MKTFSVLIPAYNAAKYITRCLSSLKNQTYSDFEVVVVDDGSSDDTLCVLQRFKEDNPQIDFQIHHQENCGAGATRNNALKLAKGEYIVFIDSDDYINKDFLEKVQEKVVGDNADVVFIDLVREKPNGEVIREERMSHYSQLVKDRLIRWQMTGKMPWGGVRKVVRRSIIATNHLEYAPIKVGEESFYSFRVLEEAKVVSFQPEAIYHYIDTGESLTSKDTISNSATVFEFVSNSLEESGKYEKYRETINALAVTTVAVALNLLSKEPLSKELVKRGKEVMEKYYGYIKDKIDSDSLDSRVKFLMPWIKLGWPLPIYLIAKLRRLTKKQ